MEHGADQTARNLLNARARSDAYTSTRTSSCVIRLNWIKRMPSPTLAGGRKRKRPFRGVGPAMLSPAGC